MQLSKKQVGSWHEREGNRHFTGEAGFWKGRGWLLRSWKETTKQLTSFYQNVDSFVKSLQWSHQDAIQIFSLYRGVECLGPTEAIGQGTAITSKWYLLFLKQKWEKIIKPRKKHPTLKQSFFFLVKLHWGLSSKIAVSKNVGGVSLVVLPVTKLRAASHRQTRQGLCYHEFWASPSC